MAEIDDASQVAVSTRASPLHMHTLDVLIDKCERGIYSYLRRKNSFLPSHASMKRHCCLSWSPYCLIVLADCVAYLSVHVMACCANTKDASLLPGTEAAEAR